MNLEDLRFDPQRGHTIVEPTGRGYGYWAGGCKALHDPESDKFYLFYRQRVPLERGRGGRCAVAESDDGIHFHDIWSATREDFCANSIEVGCPVKDPSGEWRLYVSYEYVDGNYWRVDVLRGGSLAGLDVQARRTVLLPFDYGLSFIKDPVIYLQEGAYWMYAAVSPQQHYRTEEDGTRVLVGHDATMLLISHDGLRFPRGRYVFEPDGQHWDGVRARINSIVPVEGGYAAFYDGGASFYDNYEEMCGLAFSRDMIHFERLTRDGPWVSSPYGCIRYAYALPVEGELYVYYEYTRPDLSHELRLSKVKGSPTS
jgi:hypothetical protein